jgi:hypothetical protein
MNMSDAFTISPQVRARVLGAEMVLLDLSNGMYFGLDATGSRVWQLLEAGKSLAGICDTIIEEFDVSRAVLEQDVLKLISELKDKELIRLSS